jgi:hypothetical protein
VKWPPAWDPASCQRNSAKEAEKRWRCSSVVGYSPDSKDVSTEAEESSLLRDVARKRLVETVTD